MKATVLLALLVVFQSAYARPGGRIYGGENAKPGQFPYMVSVQFRSSHYCGGSIVSRKSILTAAHCLDGSPSSYTVFAGNTSLVQNGVTYRVANYSIHPQYNEDQIIHDVAVIHLQDSIEYTQNIQPVEIYSSYVEGGLDVLTSGWGYTPSGLPDDLQFIKLKTISQEECASRLSDINFNLHPSHMCTFTRSGEGVCGGDSGSPLTLNGTQIGITSWGLPCARGYPDGFVRISTDYDWIMKNIVF